MPKLDVTGQSVRVRQRPPSAFTRGSFRTIVISAHDDIRAVVGCPLPGKESDKRKRRRDRPRPHYASSMRRSDVDRFVQALQDKGYRAEVISYGSARGDVSRYDLSPEGHRVLAAFERKGAAPSVVRAFNELSNFDKAAIRFLLTEEGGFQSRRDRLTTRKREHLRSSQFALPARRALPIHNAAHARNASARLEQMRKRGTVSRSEYIRARRAIDRAERRFGIDTSRPLGRR